MYLFMYPDNIKYIYCIIQGYRCKYLILTKICIVMFPNIKYKQAMVCVLVVSTAWEAEAGAWTT